MANLTLTDGNTSDLRKTAYGEVCNAQTLTTSFAQTTVGGVVQRFKAGGKNKICFYPTIVKNQASDIRIMIYTNSPGDGGTTFHPVSTVEPASGEVTTDGAEIILPDDTAINNCFSIDCQDLLNEWAYIMIKEGTDGGTDAVVTGLTVKLTG